MSGTTTESVVATPTGGYAVETFTTAATVTAISKNDQKVTLQTSDGKKTTFKADSQMVNYAKLQVGDKVNATVTEDLVVALWKGDTPPPDAAAGMVGLTPQGQKTSSVMVATVRMTATITAMDVQKRKVTFQFEDGSTKTIKVDKSVNLSNAAVGDRVTVVVTEAAALTVTKQ
ncbi:MAG TPA: hypothetical protein PKA66_14135 [Gemmatimonadales bacterium]|nr:hypothetical protein [Gemmatimonadales bacterium]